jgi:hypothetical protein
MFGRKPPKFSDPQSGIGRDRLRWVGEFSHTSLLFLSSCDRPSGPLFAWELDVVRIGVNFVSFNRA